jgi:hypothetical protein
MLFELENYATVPCTSFTTQRTNKLKGLCHTSLCLSRNGLGVYEEAGFYNDKDVNAVMKKRTIITRHAFVRMPELEKVCTFRSNIQKPLSPAEKHTLLNAFSNQTKPLIQSLIN